METGNRKILTATVLKSSMDKTVVVQVTRRFPHPIYKKFVPRSKKYHAHDELNKCRPGDVVRIIESRPLSKMKRWRVLEIEKTTSQE